MSSTERTENGYVVVGVDGSPADESAMRYAAAACRRLGASLRVVHVTGAYTALVPVGDLDLEDAAQSVLDEAVARAGELFDTDRVSGVLLHGQRTVALLELSAEARLVVLGEQHRNPVERFVTGSTVAGVASGAPCPVVVVPDTWDGDHHGAVGVGVKTLEGAPLMVGKAASLADARGARVEVVHSWHLPVAAYDALTLPGAVETEGWSADMRTALAGQVEPVAAEHPGVEIHLSVVEGHPVPQLVELGHRVDLIVLARRTRAFPRGHLGGTARALIREAPCPVLVLPHPGATDDHEIYI